MLTAAGTNIIGIISIKNVETGFNVSTFTSFKHKMISININPYTLDGIGKGRSTFINSPTNAIEKIIVAGFKYFIIPSIYYLHF